MLLLAELDVRKVEVLEERSAKVSVLCLPVDGDGAWANFCLEEVDQVDVGSRAWEVSEEDGASRILASDLHSVVELQK